MVTCIDVTGLQLLIDSGSSSDANKAGWFCITLSLVMKNAVNGVSTVMLKSLLPRRSVRE